MNWYKIAQSNMYGYHGTNPEVVENIKSNGLEPGTFFASNESDCSPYLDGALLRFPFPQQYEKRIARGDYYTTLEIIPPNMIEVKLDEWGEWKRL